MIAPDWTAKTRRVLVVGPSSSGKSSWAEVFLRGWRGMAWAFDHKTEFAKRCKLRQVSHLSELETALPGGRIAFNPHVDFEGRTADAFNLFAAVCSSAAKRLEGEKLFVVDELQDWIGAGRYELPASVARILESGRGYHLSTLALSQAGNLVNARLRQQFSEVVAFGQRDTRAFMFLADCGFNVEAVKSLGKLAFIHRNLDTGAESFGRLAFQHGQALIVGSGRSTARQ